MSSLLFSKQNVMKKSASILLVLVISVILFSCKQARTVIVTYNCELTHYQSNHTADLDIVKSYVINNGAQAVGSSFRYSIYGKSDEACIEEADRKAKNYFEDNVRYLSAGELRKLLGEETEFEYSFCRVQDNGDTLKIASYQYNME